MVPFYLSIEEWSITVCHAYWISPLGATAPISIADQSSMHPGYGSAPLLTIPQVGSSPPTARSSGSPAEHLDRETNDKMSSDVLQTKCIAKEPSTETTTVLSRKLKLLAVKDRWGRAEIGQEYCSLNRMKCRLWIYPSCDSQSSDLENELQSCFMYNTCNNKR